MKASGAKRAGAIEVTYTLECYPETTEIEGNASAVDDDTDRETNEWVRDQLRSGNQWAWGRARVIASVEVDGETFEGSDSLGCCSYLSEQDFRADQYYTDMCAEALADLVRNLRAASNRGGAAVVALSRLRGVL